MGCNKISFTREGAEAALGIIRSRKNNKKAEKKPCRKYYCNDCEAWHLTSQTKQEFYQLNKNKNHDNSNGRKKERLHSI